MSLSIQSVTKHYGNVLAVDNVSIEAAAGEFVVLLGPSGCGKSTLLRMVAGLEDVEGGTIALNGRDITHLAPRDRDLAYEVQRLLVEGAEFSARRLDKIAGPCVGDRYATGDGLGRPDGQDRRPRGGADLQDVVQ